MDVVGVILNAVVIEVIGALVRVAKVGVINEDSTAPATAAAAAHIRRSAVAEVVIALKWCVLR